MRQPTEAEMDSVAADVIDGVDPRIDSDRRSTVAARAFATHRELAYATATLLLHDLLTAICHEQGEQALDAVIRRLRSGQVA